MHATQYLVRYGRVRFGTLSSSIQDLTLECLILLLFGSLFVLRVESRWDRLLYAVPNQKLGNFLSPRRVTQSQESGNRGTLCFLSCSYGWCVCFWGGICQRESGLLTREGLPYIRGCLSRVASGMVVFSGAISETYAPEWPWHLVA